MLSGVVIRLRPAAAQHDVRVRIARRAHDARDAVLVNAQKTVRMPRRAHRVNRHCRLPSVLFFKPTGIERPLAISRCVCDSVVRAPIAAHVIRSAMYCGTMGSRNSVAAGSPRPLMSSKSFRAIFKPVSMSCEPSRCGSLINPFQPMVVRGFSK